MMGQINRNLQLAEQLKPEKVKEHFQHQPKAQSTESVKQSKAKNKHTESDKHSSQSESVCEQDNVDLQATTKGDKSCHSTTQSTNFVVKVRCKYCDKPFNSITNHRKHIKVCAEAANDYKICGKTFKSVKQYQNHRKACTTKSHNCMICHKTFSCTDLLAAHVKLIIHTKKITCLKCSAVWQKKFYKHIFHKNMFNQPNKWLHVNLVGGGIYSNVPDLTNNDLCISSELTYT